MTPAPVVRTARLQAALRQLGLDALLSADAGDVTHLTGSAGFPAAVWVPAEGSCILAVPAARLHGAVAPPAYRVLPRPLGAPWSAVLGPFLPARRVAAAALDPDLRARIGPPTATDLLGRLRRRQGPDAAEREGLARARRIASASIRAALDAAQPGVRETDVAVAAESSLRLARAEPLHRLRLATGPRAADPGAGPGPRVLRQGDLGFIRLCAEWEGYASPMARSFVLGPPPPEAQRLLDALLRARDAALAAIRPGPTGAEVHRAAAASLEADGLPNACPHPVGHALGGVRGVRFEPGDTEALLPGDLVLLDVGVYVEGVGGARVADTVHVTAEAADLLAGSGGAWTVVGG